ncbi:MAG: HlyD family secretion protein, partial [Pseudorhodoplanes sp.]
MSDTTLKIVPQEAKDAPAPETPAKQGGKPRQQKFSRSQLRMILLVAVPAVALVVGLGLYLAGGRYISTDNAYIGAQKVLITPDISGKIASVKVREGQRVAPGDALLVLDEEPLRIAVTQAQSRVESARTDFANLKSNDAALGRLIDLATQNVDLKRKDVERKATLLSNRAGAQADVDNSTAILVAAQNQLEQLKQQRAGVLNQLQGDPSLPIEKFPPFQQNQAALEQAQRDLDHAVLRAPIAGVATQVDSIQLGRYVTAGMPLFSLIDDRHPWVDANPKETDITYLRPGQTVTIDVDSFPNRSFHGHVDSVSPGTGAQFVVLPPQNASGNWVK